MGEDLIKRERGGGGQDGEAGEIVEVWKRSVRKRFKEWGNLNRGMGSKFR